MLAMLNSLNSHILPIFQPILMIIVSNMFLKGYPLEAKTAPKN